MQTHPFIGSVINRVMGITLSVVAWMMCSWLLFCYGGEEIWIACLDGLVSVGLLAAAGFLYGYVDGTIHALQIQVALAVLVQAISLAGAFELQVLLEQGNAGDFVDSVSLRLVFGILCWIILLQWYRMNRTDESDFEEISGTEADKGQEEAVPAGETFLDRVSVKDGSRIHIIHLEELLYLQAGGDYVTILGFACKRGDGLRASRYTKPCRIFSACGGAALYRKSILDEIGVFDELFFAYYEDVDLSWRANSFGYKNVYCPTAKCRHICGATTGAVRYNPFKSIQSGRNSILLPYKNQPLLMLVLNFIPMLLGYLLKVVMFRLRGFGNDYAKGFHEAWAALPKIDKPKFRWKNLPNYIWVEGSLIVGLFRYIVYRVQRALKIT